MFLKRFSKVLFCASKYSRLPKFSVVPFLNTQTEVLYLKRYTTTVASPTVTGDESVDDFKDYVRPHFSQCLMNHSDKYCIVNIDDIKLEEETNFKSLKLLMDFLEDSNDAEIPEELLDCFKEEVKMYGLEEIYKFIILVKKYCDSPKILKPAEQFNKELLSRVFSVEDILKILWVMKLKQCKVFRSFNYKYSTKGIRKLFFKIDKLNSNQVVQLFFLVPKLPPDFIQQIKYHVQVKLFKIIPELNLEELAIIARGFLKSELYFSHSGLPYAFINKATEEIDNMNDFLLSKICKLFEAKLRHEHAESLMEFQEKMIPHIDRFSKGTKTHLIATGSQLGCVNPSLWEIVADSFKKNIQTYNIFEITRMVHATVVYSIQDEELLNLAITHFREKIGVEQNHSCLINFLYHIIHHNLYPEDLLAMIFSEDFISQFDPEDFFLSLKQKYCFINCSAELEMPTHNLRLLDLKEREKLFHIFKISLSLDHRLHQCENSRRHVRQVIENLYGENTVYEANCLPHCETGLVMKFDKSLKAKEFNSKFAKQYYAKKALNDDDISLFIMVLASDTYKYNQESLSLSGQLRVRQLKALGYKPVLVKNALWQLQRRQGTESEFLKDLIVKSLEETSEGKE